MAANPLIEVEVLLRKVFVVLDPTRLFQPALEKAEWIAERNGAELHVYCCCYDTQLAFDEIGKRATVERTRHWIERLIAPARERGLDVVTEVGWNPDWRDAIVAAATESGADLVVKTASRHTPLARHLMKTADWTLLRSSACPTLLVSPTEPASNQVVLAAVKVRPEDETYTALNEQVITIGHRLARVLGADLHAVTAYRGQGVYFDRQKLANMCGLPRNRVHAAEGAPHRAIADVAEEIGAGVLVIGCANGPAREERGSLIGGTAQRVIDAVRADILVVPTLSD
ncbi:MAG: universal stress protein [Gammaproteobacteria bacterium]|nr:universal stress protein [Gammaproteobacteria bacterium]